MEPVVWILSIVEIRLAAEVGRPKHLLNANSDLCELHPHLCHGQYADHLVAECLGPRSYQSLLVAW
jgi:hypothetical protein